MVGAGFSRNAERAGRDSRLPPLWSDLRDGMASMLYHGRLQDAPRDPLRLAEEFRTYLGQASLVDFVRAYVPDLSWTPGRLHTSLMALPWAEVLTTNYDTLLERASGHNRVVRAAADLAHVRSPRVIKLHGSIDIRPCGRNPCHAFLTDSRIGFRSNQCVTGNREPDMLTGMTERDWSIVLEVFDAAQSSRGEPGHDDRKFLEAVHYFTVHSITWRALPSEYGKWNSVWKRFWRLSRSGVFEAFFQMLAECSQTAQLIQFFDSTTARAHVSAAGAKGGSSDRRSAARAAASRPKSTSRPISTATRWTSI